MVITSHHNIDKKINVRSDEERQITEEDSLNR